MTASRNRRIVVVPSLVVAACMIVNPAHAEPPSHLDPLKREMRIVEEVIDAALREVPGVRVGAVEADYLAGQGVLLSLSLRTPWLGPARPGPTHGKRVVRIIRDHDVAVPVPTMVHEILNDLELDLDVPMLAHRSLDLSALHELRVEQRALRSQQRKVRQRIWGTRLEVAGGEGEEDAADTVAALEAELERLEVEEDALEARIDTEYEKLASGPDAAEVEVSATAEATPAADFDTALAQAVCDYGATLKSLPRDEHLSVRVRARDGDTFHVFEFDDVVECQRGAVTPVELLGKGVSYSG